MKKVHEMKIREIEFSGYLFEFRKSMNIPCTHEFQVGEYVKMFEFNEEADIITGRNLLFRITYIDKTPGLLGIGNIWLIDLKIVRPVKLA